MQLVPNRPKSGQRRRTQRGVWPTSRLANLRTDQQFAREQRRQELLDRQWRRWQSIIFTLTISAGALTGAIPLHKAFEWVF